MTSQCTAQLLADLGVTRSLSRPLNPFSEAQFKTLKYHPSFPGRFADQGQAKTFCRSVHSAGTMPSTAMAASRC